MSAEEHRRHSGEHAKKARKHEDRYAPEVLVDRGDGRSDRFGSDYDYDYRYSGDYYWGGSSYNPTGRHLAHANKHQAHAREHLAAAQVLEQREEGQCGSFPPETRVLCPLIGQLASVEDIAGGVRVRFADGVDVNAAIAHIRCHLAVARTQARIGMDTCPLYLGGVLVSRAGQGPEVDFVVEDASEVNELRERMWTHVAPAAQ